MTGVGDDDTRGRSKGWPWFWVGVALAMGATVALVLADDIRYLRLGIVAALWAAIVGAFLALRYRKQAVSTEETVQQAQQVYELELEREIAARREYELEIEADTRERVEADSRAELDALRAEIGALRENLQSLFGGEVLLERLSLTAQATRMRALRDEQRLVEPGTSSRPALEAAASDLVDRPTELIERVREKQPARPAGRKPAPEPRRTERSLDLPPRRVTKGEPVQARGANAAAGSAKSAPGSLFETPEGQGDTSAERRRSAGAEELEQTRVQQPATPPPPGKKPARPGVVRSERSRPAMRAADESTKVSRVLDADSAPAWESPGNREPSPSAGSTPAPPTRHVPAVNAAAKPPRKPAEQPPRKPAEPTGESAFNQATSLFSPPAKEAASRSRREPQKPAQPSRREEPSRRQEPARREKPSRREEPPAAKSTSPDEARRPPGRQGQSGGRRRHAEAAAEPAAPETGGRRRRADGESPSWMQSAAADGGTRRRPGHSRPEMEPVPEPGNTGRRAAAETGGTDDESGSHTEGRSVSELLAAHGSEVTGPRRRRRAAD